MSNHRLENMRGIAKDKILSGASGPEIARLFQTAGLSIELAESELQELGFFAQAVIADSSHLYVSEGFAQPGLATLLLSFRYNKLPMIEWK